MIRYNKKGNLFCYIIKTYDLIIYGIYLNLFILLMLFKQYFAKIKLVVLSYNKICKTSQLDSDITFISIYDLEEFFDKFSINNITDNDSFSDWFRKINSNQAFKIQHDLEKLPEIFKLVSLNSYIEYDPTIV